MPVHYLGVPLKLFGRKLIPRFGITGVCRHSEGFGLAHVLRQGDEPPRVTAAGFLAAPRGALSQTLQKGVVQLDLLRSRCVGVLALGDYSLLQIEPPPVPDDELREAARWQIRELIDYPLDEAVIDIFRVPSEGLRGRSPTAYVVAAHQGTVKEQVHQLRAARLKVSAVDIPELAVRNLAMLLPEESRGVAFVFLGKTRGLMTISRGGNLYLARNINLGLDQLDCHSGSAAVGIPGEANPEYNDLLDSIVLEIQRSLDFYESSFSLSPITSLVVASTEPECPSLVAYLQAYLGVRVRPFVPAEVLDCGGIDSTQLAPSLLAVGAALRGEGPVTP